MEIVNAKVGLVWIRVMSRLYTPLSANIIREVCTYLHPNHYLVWVADTSLVYFDVSTRRFRPGVAFKDHLNIDTNSRWAAIDENRVVICGGGVNQDQAKSTAYLLHINGASQQLPTMWHGHRSFGIIHWSDRVYAFGSFVSEGATKSECIHIESDCTWQRLPDLHKQRSRFTPVAWRKCIYLCGGQDNNTLEIYDKHTIRLANFALSVSGATVGCVWNDQLVLFIGGNLDIIACDLMEKYTETTLKKHSNFGFSRSNPMPVLSNNTVFQLISTNKFASYSLPKPLIRP